jgi:hypothetical protein
MAVYAQYTAAYHSKTSARSASLVPHLALILLIFSLVWSDEGEGLEKQLYLKAMGGGGGGVCMMP